MRNSFIEMRSPITKLGDVFVECKWKGNELTKLKKMLCLPEAEKVIALSITT